MFCYKQAVPFGRCLVHLAEVTHQDPDARVLAMRDEEVMDEWGCASAHPNKASKRTWNDTRPAVQKAQRGYSRV